MRISRVISARVLAAVLCKEKRSDAAIKKKEVGSFEEIESLVGNSKI